MTQTNLSKLIDTFGALKAQQADLERQEKALKKALAELEAGAYEGEMYRLTISDSVREGVDAVLGEEIKAVIATYREGLSRQYLTAHTTETPVRTHRVTARTGDC